MRRIKVAGVVVAITAASAVLAPAGSATAATGLGSSSAAVTAHAMAMRDSQAGNHAATLDTHGRSTRARVAVSCPQHWLCFWVNSNEGGAEGKFEGNNSFWGDFGQAQCVFPHAAHDAHGTWNDCASSIYNNGATAGVDYAIVYQNSNMGGGAYCFAPQTGSSNLASIHYRQNGKPISATLNDSISSNSWAGAAQCRLIDNG
jgi:hypothetical protein